MADELAIIRKRLLTHASVALKTQEPPFTKVVKLYTAFCNSLQAGTLEDAQKLLDELLKELYSIQLHIDRLQASAGAYEREQIYYSEQQQKLNAAIEQAALDIEARKNELAAARIRLEQQQEYEAVKKQIVGVPARSVTRAEMTLVEREIADLQQQGRDLDTLMARRKTQFESIMASLDGVYESIQQDGQQGNGDDVVMSAPHDDTAAEKMQLE